MYGTPWIACEPNMIRNYRHISHKAVAEAMRPAVAISTLARETNRGLV